MLLKPILGDLEIRSLLEAIDESACRFSTQALPQGVAGGFLGLRIELGRIAIGDGIECDQRVGIVGEADAADDRFAILRPLKVEHGLDDRVIQIRRTAAYAFLFDRLHFRVGGHRVECLAFLQARVQGFGSLA